MVHAGAQAHRDVNRVNSIAALPLYHIFALTLSLLAIRWGSHLTLIPNPRDIGKFIDVLKKRPFHLLPAVNTLFNALMLHPQFKSVDFSQLCVSQAGGMAASAGTARQWQDATGCAMVEGWGMSETCAIGTNNPIMSRDLSPAPSGCRCRASTSRSRTMRRISAARRVR
jgi:acyl-CoA synthetase (AMP-forming)/AMP-acid ligase II